MRACSQPASTRPVCRPRLPRAVPCHAVPCRAVPCRVASIQPVPRADGGQPSRNARSRASQHTDRPRRLILRRTHRPRPTRPAAHSHPTRSATRAQPVPRPIHAPPVPRPRPNPSRDPFHARPVHAQPVTARPQTDLRAQQFFGSPHPTSAPWPAVDVNCRRRNEPGHVVPNDDLPAVSMEGMVVL